MFWSFILFHVLRSSQHDLMKISKNIEDAENDDKMFNIMAR